MLTPIGTVKSKAGDFVIGNGGSGAQTEKPQGALIDIQRCRAKDTHGWVSSVCQGISTSFADRTRRAASHPVDNGGSERSCATDGS